MKRLLNEAVKFAAEGSNDKHYKLAAIAVRKDGAIVYSKNGRTQTPNVDAHAEARALKKAGHGSVLYVARVKSDGTIGMARPCNKCMTIIRNMKVAKVFYTIGPNEYGTIDL